MFFPLRQLCNSHCDNFTGAVLLLTFWPAVEDDDKKVCSCEETCNSVSVISLLFISILSAFSGSRAGSLTKIFFKSASFR